MSNIATMSVVGAGTAAASSAPAATVSSSFKAGDLLRLRRETNEMEKQLRRKFILASIEHTATAPLLSNNHNIANSDNNDNTPLHKLWRKLTNSEHDDDEIVYKFLSCSGCGQYSLFGNDPWHGVSHRNSVGYYYSNNNNNNIPPAAAAATAATAAAGHAPNNNLPPRAVHAYGNPPFIEQPQQIQRRNIEQQRRDRVQRFNNRRADQQQQRHYVNNPIPLMALPLDDEQQQQQRQNNNNNNPPIPWQLLPMNDEQDGPVDEQQQEQQQQQQQQQPRHNNNRVGGNNNNNNNNNNRPRLHPTSSHPGLLPRKYENDPNAVLAFCSNTQVESLSWYFELPICMRDDKRVMMAVVQKCPRAFYQASLRLRDDEELVQLALHKPITRDRNIALVSTRLAKDPNLFMYAITMGYCTLSFAQSWLENLENDFVSGNLDIQQQKEIGRHMLRCMNEHVDNTGTMDESSMTFLSKFSDELRDDQDFMLPFIKLHWSALHWCSDRLCSDMHVCQVAVTQDVNAYQYVKGEICQEYMQRRRRSSSSGGQKEIVIVLDEVMNRGLLYENVPTHLQNNKAILTAVLTKEAGQKTLQQQRLPLHLPDALKRDRMFLLDVLAVHSGTNQFHHGIKWLYDEMTPELRVDEYIVRAMLKAGCAFSEVEKILASLPRLTTVREAMHAVVITCRFTDVIRWSSFAFRDDHDFMLQAYMSDSATFVQASERLRSNTNFIQAVLAWNRLVADQGKSSFMVNTTTEFQLENPTLVVGAIECGERNHMKWVSKLNNGVWRNKQAILACLEKGWSVLDHVASLNPPWLLGQHSPHLEDREIVARSVALCPAHLEHASHRLRDDRDFIHSLVKETDRVLHFAPQRMRRDKAILIDALARSGGTISDCFDNFEFGTDFEFLCSLASEIRSIVEYYDSFTSLFCGMTDSTCRLSLLNQGAETTYALKEMIAEYAGVHHPIQPYKAALAHLEAFGY